MIRRLLPRLFGLAALVALASLAMPALSRPADDADKELGDVPSDLKLVARDAPFFASIRVADALASKQAKGMLGIPGARPLMALAEKAGFDLTNIERLTYFARRPGSGPFTIVRGLKKLDADAIKKSLGAEEEYKAHGKTLTVGGRGHYGTALWMADEKTAVFGDLRSMVPYLATLVRPGKTHPLADELKAAAAKHSLTIGAMPSLVARIDSAFGEAMEEKYSKDRSRPKGPPPGFEKGKFDDKKFDDFPKDKKFGGEPIAFQKDFDFKEKGRPRLPDPSELKDDELKLKSLEEAFYRMDRRGPQSAFFRPAMRCRRLLVTVDVGDDVSAKATGTFATEDEAKDGLVTGKAVLILVREMIPTMFRFSPINVREKPYKEMLKSVQDGLRAGEVKRDGKTVTATAKFKIDLSGLEK